jgi:RecJ-like exonuclease
MSERQTGPVPPADEELAETTPGAGENLCPECSGSGRLDGKECPTCDGTGKVIEEIGGA